MKLHEIQLCLSPDDTFDAVVQRLQILTGYRDRRVFVARVLAPVLNVSHQVGYWWMSGRRRPSGRVVRALQLLELLLAHGQVPTQTAQSTARQLVNRARPVPDDSHQ